MIFMPMTTQTVPDLHITMFEFTTQTVFMEDNLKAFLYFADTLDLTSPVGPHKFPTTWDEHTLVIIDHYLSQKTLTANACKQKANSSQILCQYCMNQFSDCSFGNRRSIHFGVGTDFVIFVTTTVLQAMVSTRS